MKISREEIGKPAIAILTNQGIVKIPILLKNGRIELPNGAALPAIKGIASGEIRVRKSDIVEKSPHLKIVTKRMEKLLDKGKILLIELSAGALGRLDSADRGTLYVRRKDLPNEFLTGRFPYIHFIRLDQPLYIQIGGSSHGRLIDCTCFIFSLNETAGSINHAYTKLSQKYQMERRSHTGNVFDLVRYGAADQGWIPLRKLRDYVINEQMV